MAVLPLIGASQLINANGPNATSKSGSASAPINSISQENGFVNSENLATPVGQARNYAKIFGMGENGTHGLVTLSENLPDGVDLGEAALAFNAFYNQGKNGKAFSAAKNMELLSPEQRQYAYNLGIMDKALDGARGKNVAAEISGKNSGKVLQNKAESGKINNNKESAENEQGISLRDGSERTNGNMTGKIGKILSTQTADINQIIEARKDILNEIDADTEIANLWVEAISNNRKRPGSNISIDVQGRSENATNDRISGIASRSNIGRNNRQSGEFSYSTQEVDAVLIPLKKCTVLTMPA